MLLILSVCALLSPPELSCIPGSGLCCGTNWGTGIEVTAPGQLSCLLSPPAPEEMLWRVPMLPCLARLTRDPAWRKPEIVVFPHPGGAAGRGRGQRLRLLGVPGNRPGELGKGSWLRGTLLLLPLLLLKAALCRGASWKGRV